MTPLAVALFLAALNIVVSLQVLKTKVYERSQKIAQFAVIWLLPLLGALICFFTLRQITSTKVQSETEIVSNEYTENYAENYEIHRHSSDNHHQP